MIVLLLTTQNEADVLALNLEHHLSWGVDHVVVCDNESSDHTQEVVARFGDHVTSEVFADFAERQKVRTRLLERAKEKLGGRVAWVGVSDTDEFHWAPGITARELLAQVPDDVVCATYHQKLFLPTEVDAESGPVYLRQLHRTGNTETPLHQSYREGKSFYRAAWLKRVRHEHRDPHVPHEVWSPPEHTVHHYMIRDEDQFVMKVKRLTAWREREGLKSKRWYHKARSAVGMSPEKPFVAPFKLKWWSVYAEGGESGLREYYRTTYRVQARDLPGYIESGDLVRDTAFADWRAQRQS